MLPSGRLSYNLRFSRLVGLEPTTPGLQIEGIRYYGNRPCATQWNNRKVTFAWCNGDHGIIIIMMLFRIVSGLWDEVTPHYVNWVVVLQGNHRKDLNRHPQKGHEHSIRLARYGTKHISPTALAWVTGAGFEPANSGLWAQNDTTSPPRAKNRSNNRTTDRSLAKYCFGLVERSNSLPRHPVDWR